MKNMLDNKVVFVSGGTGYLGSAICRACTEYGASVIFSYYKHEDKAQELLDTIKGTKAIQLNLKDVSDTTAKIEGLYQEIERIDVLVNNAGVSQVMPFAMLEEEDLDYLLNVNVKGAVFLTKAVVRGMIRQRSGVIVNIGSIAGHRMFDVPVHYALSKAAIAGFTYALAAELKRFGIRVNSVVPGLLEDGVGKGVPEDLREDFSKHCAAGRPGTGREVADMVCFLASDRASYINGQHIFVDGGI
jgi:NAD(P)-dependent dehydrogenase (short-subunit alcohol dehydrogenase family)